MQALSNTWSSMYQWTAGLSVWQFSMLAAGVAFFLEGLWKLARARKPRPGVSMPTRLALGFAFLVLGFHLVSWTLPPGVGGGFVAIQWWWAVVLACVGLVGLSLLIDRLGWDVEPPERKG